MTTLCKRYDACALSCHGSFTKFYYLQEDLYIYIYTYVILLHEFHVLELWIEMKVNDPCSFFSTYLSSSEKRSKWGFEP